MKPVVFISHSSKDNELAEAVVRLVERGDVCRTVFDVHDLEQGREWRAQLYQWMARCQAALVLLTEAGISSDWVLQEATILRARKALEPGFRVFLVVLDEAKDRLPERWRLFEPLQLDEIQGMRTFDAGSIAGRINSAMDAMIASSRPTLYDRLAGIIGDVLSDMQNKPNTLRVLSDALGLEDATWQRVTGGNDSVVDLIARRLCRGDLGRYADLKALLDVIGQVASRDVRMQLLDVLASYWVSLSASAMIPGIAEEPPPRVLAMRVQKRDYLPYRYVERQYKPYYKSPAIVTLSGGNETLVELRTQLARQLKEEFGFDPCDLSDDGLRAMLDDEERRRREYAASGAAAGEAEPDSRVIVLLPGLRSEKLAFDLAREFPTLVFIVMVEDSSAFRTQWKSCRWIEPELPKDEELRRSAEFSRALHAIG